MESKTSPPGTDVGLAPTSSTGLPAEGDFHGRTFEPDDQVAFPTIRRRYLSTVIDLFFVLAACFVLALLFQSERTTYVRVGIIVLVCILYEPLLTSCSCTLGQKLTGIRVRRTGTLQHISLPRAYLRSSIKLLLGFYSFFSIPFTDYRRALHDLAVDSVVIDASLSRPGLQSLVMVRPVNHYPEAACSPAVLYSMPSVILATLIGSFAAGGILLAKNYARLGFPGRARIAVATSVLGTLVYLALAYALPTAIPTGVWLIATFLITYQLANYLQGPMLSEHKAAGGAFASLWRAIAVGFISAIVVIVIIACISITAGSQ